MKQLLTLLLLLMTHRGFAQDKDELAIRGVLQQQAAMWNQGDMDGYMKGYWNSDSLLFVGRNGPTYGYDATLQRYKKSYSGKKQMGQLTFTILDVKRLSKDYSFVLGKWVLKREAGDLNGSFTLIFRKIGGQWLIVSDHSS